MNGKLLVGGISLAAIAVLLITGLFGDGLGRKAATKDLAAVSAGADMMANEAPAVTPFVGGIQPGLGAPVVIQAAAVVEAPPIDETGGIPPYFPPKLQLSEAHWQGMDVWPLSVVNRKKMRYPDWVEGLLVDEVSLNSARSGMQGGDVIVNVGDAQVKTLEEFQLQSRSWRNAQEVPITVLRKGNWDPDTGFYKMKTLTFTVRGLPDLGFAQVEGAPMILPGDPRPHGYRGPCTDCHTVGKGLELAPDPDLISLPPPPITVVQASREERPHEDRGPCAACHLVKK
ncbi:MAG: magnetochrome domain-containing protein [Alphaproteobacteria bacterium]|nr:magnetochrome domain-containing protein [Alphaproteobacteria bacterium]MBF0250897.1 magnetochrome domain-containing protein [Alphaproteobacteria bacterium]